LKEHIKIEESKLSVLNHYLRNNKNAKLEVKIRKKKETEKLVVTEEVIEEEVADQEEVIEKFQKVEREHTDPVIMMITQFTLVI